MDVEPVSAETDSATNGTMTPERMVTMTQALKVYTQLLQRVWWARAGVTFHGKRDLYETLGYKRTLLYQDYRERYTRGGIAARIIDAFPAATWGLAPRINEIGKEDETVSSPFELAWQELVTRLHVWKVLVRADRLTSLGHFAVLLLGLRGQTQWDVEAQPVTGPESLLYINTYGEDHLQIRTIVTDSTSPLFGRPASYSIDFSRRSLEEGVPFHAGPLTLPDIRARQVVHASRVLHFAEDGLEDDIIGRPRLRACWNYLDDLEKVIGGTSEMTWQDAKRRLVLSLAADAQMDAAAVQSMDTVVDEFMHEMRNVLKVQGIDVTQLTGTVPDAGHNIDKLVDILAGTVRIPRRMLVGSEHGELASTQDENNWAMTIQERQHQYAEPVILRPFIDRLILLQVLPVPHQGYTVEWPNILAISEKARAEVAKLWSEAIATYAGTLHTPQDVVPLEIYLQDILEYNKEVVGRIMTLLGAMPALP